MLTSAQLVKAQGQFDLKDVSPILAGLPDAKSRYPQHTHQRLIDVMRHFELCFEFTDCPGRYLIPRHLHDNEPDIEWDDADALKSKAEAEQWGQVLEFREKFPKEGLWWPYKGKGEFEKLARNHLINYIRNLEK